MATEGVFGYSYGLTVVSLVLSVVGLIMVAATRRAVKGHLADIAPDGSEAPTVDRQASLSILSSGPCFGPFGQSQFSCQCGHNPWFASRASAYQVPSGDIELSTFPRPTAILPSGRRSDRRVSFMTENSSGGGNNASRHPGRLPPIFGGQTQHQNDNQDSPPTYLEAIGHNSSHDNAQS